MGEEGLGTRLCMHDRRAFEIVFVPLYALIMC